MTFGKPGILHGFQSYLLQDEDGNPAPVYSVASGLDYPSVGPEHAFLHDVGRINYVSVSDDEAMDAFYKLCRLEGIIPAVESSHALAYAIRYAKEHETCLLYTSDAAADLTRVDRGGRRFIKKK